MVKKLLKHELYALFRVLAFFAAAVVLFAVGGRVLIAVLLARSEESGLVVILTAMVCIFYVISMLALVVAAYALGANRFYKTLFTGEGYMTLSLPLSPVGLIAGKLISSLIALFFASAVSALSVTLFLVGWNSEVMDTIFGAFSSVLQAVAEAVYTDPLSFAEGIVKLIFSIPMVLLIIFAVISLGQTFTAHRKGITFAILIGVYFVWNVASSLLLYPLSVLSESVSPHLTNWLVTAIYAGVDVGCFFFIRYILKNKVNLIA